MPYGPDREKTRPSGIEGLFMRQSGMEEIAFRQCASLNPACASFGLLQHKKGAGVALTRLLTLRHNQASEKTALRRNSHAAADVWVNFQISFC
jgi:hypothetical protein